MRRMTQEEAAEYDRITSEAEQLQLDNYVQLGQSGLIYGYARISTPRQKLQRQIDNIKEAYPGAKIIKEQYTGVTTDRPEWKKLERILQPGDLIVFDEVSRMSRDAEEGFQLYEKLFCKGVQLVFLKEPYINTSLFKSTLERRISLEASTGRESVDKYLEGQEKLLNTLILDLAKEQIKLCFEASQREVELLRQRTSEGVRRAQADGKQIGRATGEKVDTKKAKESRKRIWELSRSFTGTLSDKDCIKLLGLSRNTYYKYKKQIEAGLYNPIQ